MHRICSVRYPASNRPAERAIKTIKTAFTAKLDSANWVMHLPIIVLSLNSMIKEELQTSAVEILFGQCLRLPGDIVTPEPRCSISSDIIENTRCFAESLHSTSTRVQQTTSVFLPKTLNTCKYVFVGDDSNSSQFVSCILWCFLVVERNQEVFKVLKRGRLVSVGINNIKPGYVLQDLESPQSPPPFPSERQSTSDQSSGNDHVDVSPTSLLPPFFHGDLSIQPEACFSNPDIHDMALGTTRCGRTIHLPCKFQDCEMYCFNNLVIMFFSIIMIVFYIFLNISLLFLTSFFSTLALRIFYRLLCSSLFISVC